MANAPGIGPKLDPSQEFALEVTARLALHGSRDELARIMRQLHHDNMLLRQAIMEFFDAD